MIYPSILHKELEDANIDVIECTSEGVVRASDGAYIENRPDVAAIIAAHKSSNYDVDAFGQILQTEVVFTVPVIAPDFQVGSPKPKDDPVEAMDEAELESKKPRKSIALIALSLAQYAKHVEGRLKKGKV